MKHHRALLAAVIFLCPIVLLFSGASTRLRRPTSPLNEIIARSQPQLRTEFMLPARVIDARHVAYAQNTLEANGICAEIEPPAGRIAELVLDFGREVVGYLRLKTLGGPASIRTAYGESLQECLQDKPYQPIDRITARPPEWMWTNAERRAFRYVRIIVSDCRSPLLVDYVGLQSVGYPVDNRGSFRCSDEMLNHIWETGRHTARLCMQECHEDGIKRDRKVWIGDLRVQALSSYYAFGDYELARLDLMRFAANQLPDGAVPATGPEPSTLILPDYCAYWVSAVWEHYLHSGDAETLRLLYPHVRRQMAWFERHLDRDSLIEKADRPGWWCFIDWADVDRHDRVTALQAAYHEALASAERIAQALGDDRSADRYNQRALKVRESVDRLLWLDDAGAYADCRTRTGISSRTSMQTNALAVTCGIAGRGRWDDIYRALSDPSRTQPAITPYMSSYAARALYRMERDRAALDLVRQCWGGMIRRGATTFWEIHDHRKPHDFVPDSDMSFCHGWSSGVVSLLPSEIAGIRPLAPGFREISIAPRLGDLEWVEAVTPTPLGDVRASWRRNGSALSGSLAIPGRATARIRIPCDPSWAAVRINGRVVWSGGRPASGASLDRAHLVVEVPSGEHKIIAQ